MLLLVKLPVASVNTLTAGTPRRLVPCCIPLLTAAAVYMYTCTGKLRTCVHSVLYVARLQNLRIDIDLNLLHQYPQTQPVASKDKAKNLIRKPDTQKKPNLTPRETESPN